MRPLSLHLGGSLLALALTACGDRAVPTQPTPLTPDHIDRLTCTSVCGGVGGGGGTIPLPPLGITALTLANGSLPIGGVSGSYTATLGNDGAPISGVALQGYIVQGATRRAAGGVVVDCHVGAGVLPTYGCQMSFTVTASNATSGVGTLVPGSAAFELDLITPSVTLTRTVSVYLIPGTFGAAVPTTLDLSGALTAATLTLHNDGVAAVPGLGFQATVKQGSAQRLAGSRLLACGVAAPGTLPGNSTCVMAMTLALTSASPGTGTLVACPAVLQLQFMQGARVLSTRSYAITLIDTRPPGTHLPATCTATT